MNNNNKVIADRAVEMWNRHDGSQAADIFSPNYRCHDESVPPTDFGNGPQGFQNRLAFYTGAFPDTHFTVEQQAVDGKTIVNRWRVEGTHRGKAFGIAPTGKKVYASGCSFLTIENGQITEERVYWTSLSLLAQLGLCEHVVGLGMAKEETVAA